MSGDATQSDTDDRIEQTNAGTLKSRRITLKQVAPIMFVIGGLFVAVLIAQNINQRYDTSTVDDTAADNPSPAQKWTKTEFIQLVAGKTKAQIRAEFGSPDSVQGSEWLYFHLPVYDKDAGAQVGTTDITFGSGWTFMLQLFNRQCVDQDPLNEDCANDVAFN